MRVADFPPTEQAPFANGTAVVDDDLSIPEFLKRNPDGGVEAVPAMEAAAPTPDDIPRSRPVEYLHKVGDETVPPGMPVAKISAPAAGSNTLSRAQHRGRINDAWLKGEAAYIETGRFLLAAKAELDRDAFKVLVKELDFDPANGRKFMRVAARPILRAPAHKIPPSWTSRYELSKLNDDGLEAAIADGRVHRKMTRKDAIAIRKPADKGQAAPQTSKLEIARAALNALSKDERTEFVRGEPVELFLAGMSDDQRTTLAERLIGQQIENASPVIASASGKKLLASLTSTFYAGLGQADPAAGAQALTMIKRKLEANGHTFKDIVITWAKPQTKRTSAKLIQFPKR
jgi:hypothetical protein